MNELIPNESISQSIAGFDAVWRRVTGVESPFSEDETLKGFILDETCSAAFYTSLARMFQNGGRATLLGHATEAKRRARRLRAEYFIRSGVSYAPGDSCLSVTGKLASLRTAMEKAQTTADAYRAAADRTGIPELREIYAVYANDADARALVNRALLIESF